MKTKKIITACIISFLLVAVSFFLDDYTAYLIAQMRTYFVTVAMFFITDFGIILFAFILIYATLKQKKYKFLIFMFISAVIAIEIVFILKNIFQVPRPYLLNYQEPLLLVSGYSFPSIHAAFAASIFAYQKYIFTKKQKWIVYLFLFLIVFSRVYLGVHTLSDVVAGAAAGFLTTMIFINFENRFHAVKWFTSRITDKFELRRQSAHMLLGVAIVALIKLQLLNYQILFGITLAGGILVLIARKIRIPLIHDILEYFERPRHMARFPGRGSFFLFLGASLSTLIFEQQIAMAAIMIMAVGDSVTNIVGRHFGILQNPFNRKKNLEGTFTAIICATLAAFYFVPLWPALIASVASMTIESIDLGWKKFEVEIDDNVIIPLVAGAVLAIMM